MLHTKFHGNRSAGSGEEDFLRVFTIYGRGGHLGHVTSTSHQIFISLYLRAFIQSLDQIDTVVSEKIQFEFFYVHDLGPRSRNETFRSQAAIVSEKSTVFTFSYKKPMLPNLTLP